MTSDLNCEAFGSLLTVCSMESYKVIVIFYCVI